MIRALVVLALLAPATAMAAPVLEPLSPCYVSVDTGDGFETEPVAVVGSGFAPGAAIEVSVDGEPAASDVFADAGGAIDGSVAAPGVAAGERPFTVTATQADDPSQSVSATAKVSNLTARLRPRRASPRRRVRFRGRGFTEDAPVYAHYVRGGRERRTVRLGRPTGDCGVLSVRRRQFPFKPRRGRWTVQLDQSREFPTEGASVSIDIRVRRARI